MILAGIFALMAVCAVGPALLFMVNLRKYCPPPEAGSDAEAHVAVLIPARNEEANIRAALACVLASSGATVEVCVLDDDSTDATAAIVDDVARSEARVRLLRAGELPAGWNGKQHACWQLAQASTAPIMLFLDADVRLAPEAIARMAAFQQASGAALVSGFPRLVTVTTLEWLLLPLIHFVLLGFLPISRMRRSADPAFAAGCGQFMMVEREAYFASGGHAAIRATMHDGLLLPRALRRAGFRTDLADLTELASVRMYGAAREVWMGLAKNATEGIAAPKRIVPLTLLLLLGQVAPMAFFLLLFLAYLWLVFWGGARGIDISISRPILAALLLCGLIAAITASYLPRLLAVKRFRQPLKSALLHPLGIALLLCIQWYALVRHLLGRPVGWRARSYAADTGTEVGQ